MHETFLYLCSLYRVLHKLSLNVVSFNVRRLVVKSKEVSAGELCICVSFLPLALSWHQVTRQSQQKIYTVADDAFKQHGLWLECLHLTPTNNTGSLGNDY